VLSVDAGRTAGELGKNFFARAENIATSLRYGATRIYGDTADADFSLLLRIRYKDTNDARSDANEPARAAGA
jgi:hypothetical protein